MWLCKTSSNSFIRIIIIIIIIISVIIIIVIIIIIFSQVFSYEPC